MQLHFVEAQTRALTLVLVLLSCSESVHGANPLYVSMITSFGEFGFNASGVIPAIDLALEHINARPDLLPGYELGYLTLQDSGVRYVNMQTLIFITAKELVVLPFRDYVNFRFQSMWG